MVSRMRHLARRQIRLLVAHEVHVHRVPEPQRLAAGQPDRPSPCAHRPAQIVTAAYQLNARAARWQVIRCGRTAPEPVHRAPGWRAPRRRRCGRAGRRGPGEDVEMGMAAGPLNEALDEQRRGDRSGEARTAGIVEVGDLALEQAVVALPQRQPPDGVVLPLAVAAISRARSSSSVNKAGRSGPSATRAAPVRVARSMSRSGASSSASASASASTSRPSASVLPISTVSPLRLVSTSPGRKASPAIALSTAGTSTRRRTQAAPMIMAASPSALAAPPMSFFISAMLLDDLMSSPPVSKHTPLPTTVTLGASAGPQLKSMSGLLRGLAAPTVWISGKPLASSSPLITRNSAPWRPARSLAAASSSAGPRSPAGVLTRSRVSATAWPLQHLAAVHLRRRHEPGRGAVGAAVAVEAIAFQKPAERRQPGSAGGSPAKRRCLREARWQACRPRRDRPACRVAEPEEHPATRHGRPAARPCDPPGRQSRGPWPRRARGLPAPERASRRSRATQWMGRAAASPSLSSRPVRSRSSTLPLISGVSREVGG
jgi:hypothetical protein